MNNFKTSSEHYLAKLAECACLSFWSFPNVFIDRGRKNDIGDGKELCDLLVVFDKNIIIFSDKSCKFPNKTDMNLEWSRWYKKAIEKSANQLRGARDWIKKYPSKIFLDSKCEKPFPLKLPNMNEAKFHLIAVAKGAETYCKQYKKNHKNGLADSGAPESLLGTNIPASASFIIDTNLIGINQHLQQPFTIGKIFDDEQYIHVFNSTSLDDVLLKLDTITDLINYLDRKECFLMHTTCPVWAAGEEELVAIYLSYVDKNEQHYFPEALSDGSGIAVRTGSWQTLVNNVQFYNKKHADCVSYVWDSLIERFAKYASGPDIEPALRIMASESRVRRRMLGKAFGEMTAMFIPANERFTRIIFSDRDTNIGYLFLALPCEATDNQEDYRKRRQSWLTACCKVMKLQNPTVMKIVGIAFEPGPEGSQDLCFFDYESGQCKWDSDAKKEAYRLEKECGIFQKKNVRLRVWQTDEYPKRSTMN